MTRPWVLVTGSSRGIGRAIALRLAKEGYNIAIHCRQSQSQALEVLDAIQALGACGRILTFDVANRGQAAQAITADIEKHGTYYGVVCNAGISADNAFPAMTGEEWDSVIHTNLDGFYNVLNPIVMPMVRRRAPGRIVTLSSVSGIIGNRGQTNYSAAKAGIIGATKALAVELAKRGITVNCVAPGLIHTPMWDELPEKDQQFLLARQPTGKLGDPDDIAETVMFLADDEAGFVTGQVLYVCGGRSLFAG